MHDSQKSSPWILRGKLRPPVRRLLLIEREKLLESMDKILDYQASIVVAPAGYGKTTLLTQWRERLIAAKMKVGWFSLDEQDSAPHRFLRYMILSLSETGVDLDQLETFARHGLTELTLEAALASFLTAIEQSGDPIVLILDDYHRVESPLIDKLLDKVIENSPKNFHLIVSSRQRPAFSVAHLCATGRGIEIGTEKLRFSTSEIQLALSDIQDKNTIEGLTATTEGWPVAVQLARLAYGKNTDSTSLRPITKGHEGHVAEFLSEQVVRSFPKEVQTFLTRTAILDQFNHELANAVYGGGDSWRLVSELSDLKALIVSLDEEGDWYRYHHLFAEYLVNCLKVNEPDRIPQMYLRASEWYEQDGDTHQAVRYAVLAGDFQRAASLIEAAGGWKLILFGGIGCLRNMLNLIPAAQFLRFPRLGIAKAHLLLKTGDVAGARALFDSACTQHQIITERPSEDKEFLQDSQSIRAFLSVYEDDLDSIERWCKKGAQILPNKELDCATNAVLTFHRAVQEIYTGRFDCSGATIQNAMQQMRQADCRLGLNYCYAYAAINDFHQCKFNHALANAHESSAMATRNFGLDSGLRSISDIVTISLQFWRNEVTANSWLSFEAALNHITHHDGWFELFALGFETQIERHLLHRDTVGAARSIEAAKKLALSRSLNRLNWHAETMELRVAIEQGEKHAQHVLGRRISKRFPIGAWQKHRYFWRNQVHSSLALANYYSAQGDSRGKDFALDAIEVSRQLGARFMLLRALVTYAVLLDRDGREERAMEVLDEAVQMAALQGVYVAVANVRGVKQLLHRAQEYWRSKGVDTKKMRFINEAIIIKQRALNSRAGFPDKIRLSPREQAVLGELSLGLSNKQIARALDTTEHTVKFHLKNVFRKLSVSRRTEAVKVAYEHKLV